ncbi:MAG: hypothetical protein V1794_04095 [Candidatus Glassbacteria bacterium]
MTERVILALRRAGKMMFVNPWLLGVAALYTILGPLLMVVGTGLPVLIWWASGRRFQPELFWRDLPAFILSHWQLILFSLAGCFVGFTLYLLVFLFYHGGLIGAVCEAMPAGEAGSRKVGAHVFWKYGRELFGESGRLATLASLVPLLPAAGLLAVASVAAFRLPAVVANGIRAALPALAVLALLGLVFLVLTVITGWIALIWYRLALCAVCVDWVRGSAALGRVLGFVSSGRWKLLLLYVIAVLLLSFLSFGVTVPFMVVSRLLRDSNLALSIMVQLLSAPLSFALGVLLEVWLKGALVAIYMDNR